MHHPPIICQINEAIYVFHILCFNKKNQVWKKKHAVFKKGLKITGEIWFTILFFKVILLLAEMNIYVFHTHKKCDVNTK